MKKKLEELSHQVMIDNAREDDQEAQEIYCGDNWDEERRLRDDHDDGMFNYD